MVSRISNALCKNQNAFSPSLGFAHCLALYTQLFHFARYNMSAKQQAPDATKGDCFMHHVRLPYIYATCLLAAATLLAGMTDCLAAGDALVLG